MTVLKFLLAAFGLVHLVEFVTCYREAEDAGATRKSLTRERLKHGLHRMPLK